MRATKWCVLALMAVLSASCVWNGFPGSNVVGNGNVVEEVRSLTGYSSVSNSGIFNVHVVQGTENSFKVECEENLLPLLITRVEDSTLIIEMSENSIRQTKSSNIYITLTELNELKNSGVGNVDITRVSGNALKIDNSGVGNLKVDIDYARVDCRNTGVGNLVFMGGIMNLKLTNKGVGNVTANEINPDIAYIENSGVGNVKIRCARELSIFNHGVGNVRYMGTASLKEIESEGVGSVKRSEE